MSSQDSTYHYAFNELAGLILYGNVVDSHCWSRNDCEKSLKIIDSIVEKMKKLIDKMED